MMQLPPQPTAEAHPHIHARTTTTTDTAFDTRRYTTKNHPTQTFHSTTTTTQHSRYQKMLQSKRVEKHAVSSWPGHRRSQRTTFIRTLPFFLCTSRRTRNQRQARRLKTRSVNGFHSELVEKHAVLAGRATVGASARRFIALHQINANQVQGGETQEAHDQRTE